MNNRDWMRAFLLVCITAIVTAGIVGSSNRGGGGGDNDRRRPSLVQRIVEDLALWFIDAQFRSEGQGYQNVAVIHMDEPESVDKIDFSRGW